MMARPSAAPRILPAFLQQSKAAIHAKFVDLEWEQRQRLLQGSQASDPPSQWTRLSGDSITARNRYLNVEPFAQNRVKLRVEEGINDYINASPITVGRRRYIATQGPKDTSFSHFYQMLAAEVASPIVVVMLTQTHEGGREKCFQYYPLSAQESPLLLPAFADPKDGSWAQVVLEQINTDPKSRCQVRTLRLCQTTDTLDQKSQQEPPPQPLSDEKEIKHLLFSGWPDFLVPEGDDRTALVELVRLSAHLNGTSATGSLPPASDMLPSDSKADDSDDNPRIVHCSAGVGRSGTFIALDALLAALNAGELDDLPGDRDPVVEIVDSLRQQRMMMVQGEAQFVFLYEVLREQLLARWTTLDEGKR